MIHIPNMLLLGSMSRNSGKTGLACSLIDRLTPTPAALKVTTVHAASTGCPRGKDSCGVCRDLKGRYCLGLELGTGNKDTQRLLAAGASPVFWLRARPEALEDGVREFLSRVPAGTPIIAESNALRRVVHPGLFLMVERSGAKDIKPGARALANLADYRVFSDGNSFFQDSVETGREFQPANIRFGAGGFTLSSQSNAAVLAAGHCGRHRASAVILAGGRSRRIGHDKALLDFAGEPLIKHLADRLQPFFDEVIISTDTGNRYPFLGLPEVQDPVQGAGPLAGILAGLDACRNEICFFLACDIPNPDINFMTELLQIGNHYDAVVPRYPDGRIEPLFAVYRKSIAPMVAQALKAGTRRIRRIYSDCNLRYVERKAEIPNINLSHDYERLRAEYESHNALYVERSIHREEQAHG